MKRLVLLGGGHSHLEVLRSFGIEPAPGVELLLINPAEEALYSGMLPGFVAGHYSWEQCTLDLRRLSAYAGAGFRVAAATAIDPERRIVHCADGSTAPYDLLSIDTGSDAAADSLPGAAEHALMLKPGAQFRARLATSTDSARERPGKMRIAVVGMGAGGVELCLALEHRLRTQAGGALIDLLGEGDILPGHPGGVRKRIVRILRERGVNVRTHSAVTGVDPGKLRLASGATLESDCVILVTGAAPGAWLRVTGLAVDAQGYVRVNDCLQSTSHADVFAAGDAAGIEGLALPKSGVHAVRQGPLLAANLKASLCGASLRPYRGSSRALYLISAGARHAVMSWAPFAAEGAWVWRWKDWIDRRFVGKYRRLQAR